MWQNPCVAVYPEIISELSLSPDSSGVCEEESSSGKSANFICGTFLRFSLRVEPSTKRLEEIKYLTNGCGFAIAVAETLAKEVRTIPLTDLHGIKSIKEKIISRVGELPRNRHHCSEMAIEALRAALANYREHVIHEFQGEKALICTCFGVTEDSIIAVIEENRVVDLEQFSGLSSAGSGCGSCQMLIQGLIDASRCQIPEDANML